MAKDNDSEIDENEAKENAKEDDKIDEGTPLPLTRIKLPLEDESDVEREKQLKTEMKDYIQLQKNKSINSAFNLSATLLFLWLIFGIVCMVKPELFEVITKYIL